MGEAGGRGLGSRCQRGLSAAGPSTSRLSTRAGRGGVRAQGGGVGGLQGLSVRVRERAGVYPALKAPTCQQQGALCWPPLKAACGRREMKTGGRGWAAKAGVEDGRSGQRRRDPGGSIWRTAQGPLHAPPGPS